MRDGQKDKEKSIEKERRSNEKENSFQACIFEIENIQLGFIDYRQIKSLGRNPTKNRPSPLYYQDSWVLHPLSE